MTDSTKVAPVSHHSEFLGVLGYIFIALVLLSTILRFWSRALLVEKKFQADDWTALAAGILSIAYSGNTYAWTEHGAGQHADAIPYETLQQFLKLLWSGDMVWVVAMALTRSSALFFYVRIFRPSKTFSRVAIWIGQALNAIWALAFLLLLIFNCHPISKYWNPLEPGKCLSFVAGYIASGITAITLDVYILLLPMPHLWRLNFTVWKKILTALVFCLSYCAIVFEIGKLVAFIRVKDTLNTDPSWTLVTPGYWANCGLALAIVTANLPSILRLFRRGIQHGPKALFTASELTAMNSRRTPQLRNSAIGPPMMFEHTATHSPMPPARDHQWPLYEKSGGVELAQLSEPQERSTTHSPEWTHTPRTKGWNAV